MKPNAEAMALEAPDADNTRTHGHTDETRTDTDGTRTKHGLTRTKTHGHTD